MNMSTMRTRNINLINAAGGHDYCGELCVELFRTDPTWKYEYERDLVTTIVNSSPMNPTTFARLTRW